MAYIIKKKEDVPSWWVRARHCRDLGNCDFINAETAHRCKKCGYPIEGEWGDHYIFDGYFCQYHQKWISGPKPSIGCPLCTMEGLVTK